MSVQFPETGWPRRRALSVGLLAAGVAATGSACGANSQPTDPGHGKRDPRDASRKWAKETVAKMSKDEKIGQLFVTFTYGQTADTQKAEDVKRNQDFLGVDNAQQLIEKYYLGGIIYFEWADNLANPKKVAGLSNGLQSAALDSGAKVPLLISTDQEQGVVVRIREPAAQFPGGMAVGASADEDLASEAAAVTGTELRAMGINQDFAPDADVNVNPANPVIGVRSFSSDPQLAAKMTAAQIQGFQSADYQVAATAKHFPGHGDTNTDSHTDLPVIEHSKKEWQKLDAPPFQAAIEAGVDSIMTAHIQFPALDDSGDPATLSKPIVTDLLRDKLGYDGMVVTDSLSMAGVNELYSPKEVPVLAIRAGVDMLLKPPELDTAINAVRDAVDSKKITADQLDQAVVRILTLKHFRGIVDKPYADMDKVDTIVGAKKHLKSAQRVSEAGVTLIKNDAKALPISTKSTAVLVTGADDGDKAVATVSDALSAEGVAATALSSGMDPDQAAIDSAVDKAGSSDVVVVLSRDVANHAAQAKLVEAVRGTGKPVVVVAIKEPYDINGFPKVDSYVATYSYSKPALQAAARVLTGSVKPTAKLPVMIPTASDADKPLFDFGHGLTY